MPWPPTRPLNLVAAELYSFECCFLALRTSVHTSVFCPAQPCTVSVTCCMLLCDGSTDLCCLSFSPCWYCWCTSHTSLTPAHLHLLHTRICCMYGKQQRARSTAAHHTHTRHGRGQFRLVATSRHHAFASQLRLSAPLSAYAVWSRCPEGRWRSFSLSAITVTTTHHHHHVAITTTTTVTATATATATGLFVCVPRQFHQQVLQVSIGMPRVRAVQTRPPA